MLNVGVGLRPFKVMFVFAAFSLTNSTASGSPQKVECCKSVGNSNQNYVRMCHFHMLLGIPGQHFDARGSILMILKSPGTPTGHLGDQT